NNNNNRNMSHLSSVFVPFESLTRRVINSVVSVATTFRKPGHDYSERTILIFLLEINERLKEIEKQIQKNSTEIDQSMIQHTRDVRQWLVDTNKQTLNWIQLEKKYSRIAGQNCDEMANYYGSNSAEPYFELKVKTRYAGVLQSREYIKRFRENGFNPKELKLYWNVKQIENLREYPVSERNNSGRITYITNGIEKAVFDVPENAQIILLNFAVNDIAFLFS
ncbi:unnamed protein product, partial [Rotaria magnacalcarata]